MSENGPIGAETIRNGIRIFKILGVNLMAAGQTVIIPAVTARYFVPFGIPFYEITAFTGAGVVSPIVSFGQTTPWTDLVGLTTLSTSPAVLQAVDITATKPTEVCFLGTVSVYFNVDTPASGGTLSVLTATIYLPGFIRA
jgi:hypothetical protein